MEVVGVVMVRRRLSGSRDGWGERAEVVGVKMVESCEWGGPAACFELRYGDGSIRYQAIEATGEYRILGYDRERGGYELGGEPEGSPVPGVVGELKNALEIQARAAGLNEALVGAYRELDREMERLLGRWRVGGPVRGSGDV